MMTTQPGIMTSLWSVRGPAGEAAAECGGNLGYSVAKCHPLEDEESLARRRQHQQAKGTNEEGKYHG
jgi:hypothetical protein